MRTADQVQSLRVVRPVIEKSLQHATRVAVLFRGDVGRANLAPDLLLRVRLIALHHLLEMGDGFSQAPLGARDASQLIVGVDFVRIDVDRALKTFAGQIKFASLLMYKSQIVMRR